MIGLGKYVGVSSLAAGAVLYHAFATREQFYPAMQYLTSSKLAIAVMGNLSFALALCTYRLLTKIFLGSLREAEVERVNERISQAVMETCLAMTIFREEFNISFVAMFAMLTFVKVFHWLVQDRVDYVETTPSISVLQHVRILSFMCLLLMVDNMFLQHTITETIKHGPSVLLLFAFEYVIQASVVVSTALKYFLIFVDNTLEGRWESKGVYVFYLELITDMFHLFVYLLFFVIVFSYYGLPLHLVRDLYWTFRNFRQRVSDFLRYRRVTANMNERFPNATPEDLARCDNTCIICREEMSPEGANKKLPCGHVFHLPCLRSWLERQQNCPTCRANVLTAPGAADNNRRPPAAAAAAADENNNAEPAPGAEAPAAAAAAPGAAGAAAQQPADAPVQAPGAARAPAAPQPHPAEPPAVANFTRGSLRHRHPQAPGAQPGQARQQQQQQPRPRPQSLTQAPGAASSGGSSARRRPQQPPGQHQYQQHPGMAAWYPLQQQPMQQQYAGQQPPIAVSMPAGSMPTMSVPMVPMQLLMPQHAVAVPAYSGSATPEQHQAAVAAAAAAAAAVCNPWNGMMGGMLIMPPTMVPMAQPRRQRPQDGAATPGSSSSSSASASTGIPSAASGASSSTAPASSAPTSAAQANTMGPSTIAAATATAAAAAAASAATAAAMMSSSSSQMPSTAVQVLRSHIEYLQSQIRTIEGAQTASEPPQEGTSQAAATEKGKEKVPAEEAPASSSTEDRE